MTDTIEKDSFLKPFFAMLEETFDTHHGIFLDKGTSLFQTLEGVSAEQASIPVGGKCATLAAQVAHITFYIELLEKIILTGPGPAVDWGEIWRAVGEVSPQEWDTSREKLRQAAARITRLFHENPNWNEDSIGGALAVLVHTVYHLGEIRQALCTLR